MTEEIAELFAYSKELDRRFEYIARKEGFPRKAFRGLPPSHPTAKEKGLKSIMMEISGHLADISNHLSKIANKE